MSHCFIINIDCRSILLVHCNIIYLEIMCWFLFSENYSSDEDTKRCHKSQWFCWLRVRNTITCFCFQTYLVFRKSHIEYNGVRLFADKLHSAELWCIECTWFCLCVCIDRLRATLYIAVRLLFVRGCTTIYYSKSNQYTCIRPSGGNVLMVFERYNY